MANQITHAPPFEIPQAYKKYTRWSKRSVPDGYSDGDARHWPGGPQYRPSKEEFYLCVLGQQWAEKDGNALPSVQYYIDKLPDGYAMFETDQHGGPQTYRRLFGHPSGRFYDSATKFALHFLWLMSGMDGDCECIYCAKKVSKPVGQRQTRAPREVIDRLAPQSFRHELTDDDTGRESSRASSTGAGIASKRSQRHVRQAGASAAVDEEGTEDIYKDCVKKLENSRDDPRGVEIDLAEDGSIDWKADRQSLPRYLTQIEQQHCFVPRIGELVLWCPSFLHEHHILRDPQTSEYKFYSFEQRTFHGLPAWRGGVVTATPSASVKNGAIDFPDILDTPTKKTSFNTAGFRIETLPDPNDDMDKSTSKQYRYVPLNCLRPLSQWQLVLKGIPQPKLHPSVEHALTCMTSLSLIEKWRFNGKWPNARIFCKGIYLGSELITLGDTVRIVPSSSDEDLRPDVLVVDSIQYNLLQVLHDHAKSEMPHLSSKSYISFLGSAYTNNIKKLKNFYKMQHMVPTNYDPLASSEVKTLFRSVGAKEYGPWYRWHSPRQKYEVSHERVLGRLYEADAVRLWTSHKQIKSFAAENTKPDIHFDAPGILAGRRYASATDARLPEPKTIDEINWHLCDTRVESLAIETVNGIEVGKFHDIRTQPTLKSWRMQVRVADGQQISKELEEEYIKDLSQIQLYSGARRGRPPGSKVVDGKLIRPGQRVADGAIGNEVEEDVRKPSSQMAGAALASGYDDSEVEEEYYTGDEDENETEGNGNRSGVVSDTIQVQRVPPTDWPKTNLSKAAIMSSVEIPDEGFLDDESSDEGEWLAKPLPPFRGGTEESSGGDYRE